MSRQVAAGLFHFDHVRAKIRAVSVPRGAWPIGTNGCGCMPRWKRARLAEALTGRFTSHHAALLGEVLAHIEYLEATVARLSERIEAVLRPYAEQVAHLQTIPGVDRTAAETIIAEIGLDMQRFPSAAHLASWAGICPGNHESAGKRKTGKTRKGNNWLKPVLTECGWGAGCARRTYLGAPYARLGRRRGKKKAVLVVGHGILVAAYHILRDGVPYHDLGPEHFDRLATERLTRHYVRRLENLGYRVELTAQLPEIFKAVSTARCDTRSHCAV